MMVCALLSWTWTTLVAIAVVVAGLPIYYAWRFLTTKR